MEEQRKEKNIFIKIQQFRSLHALALKVFSAPVRLFFLPLFHRKKNSISPSRLSRRGLFYLLMMQDLPKNLFVLLPSARYHIKHKIPCHDGKKRWKMANERMKSKSIFAEITTNSHTILSAKSNCFSCDDIYRHLNERARYAICWSLIRLASRALSDLTLLFRVLLCLSATSVSE